MKRKTVLITGASRGIGKAAALLFAKEGYDMILNCQHSLEAVMELSDTIQRNYGVSVLLCMGDVGSYVYVRTMFQEIEAFCKGVDVLINNAGISYIGLLSDMDIKDWNRIMDTNLTSVFACCKFAVPYMVSQKYGKIINISSDWGLVGASCETAYSASKGAVNTFTKALAKELAPSNIQVNAIACGVIDTQMNACFSPEERSCLTEEIPAGRFGSPDEAADMILMLVNAPDYLTGQVIALDGGWQ